MRPRLCELELERLRRHDRAGERHPLVQEKPQPGANHDGRLFRLGAQVGGSNRQRRRSAARARDAAVAGAGRAVVSGGRDDERVEPQCAANRLRLGRVGEGRVRGREPDQRDPGGVVCVAVEVRVDRALEPGDQLVGSPVDRPAAGQVALPAGHADRQDRGAGRNTRDSARATRADEQPGHLGPVLLEPGRVVRVGDGRGAAVHVVDEVDPGKDPPAQVRMRTVDSGVEEGDRHPAAVVAGEGHRRKLSCADREAFLPEQAR